MTTLKQCYRAIGLGDFNLVRSHVGDYLGGLGNYRTNEYVLSPQGRAAVLEAWGPIFKEWGYEVYAQGDHAGGARF